MLTHCLICALALEDPKPGGAEEIPRGRMEYVSVDSPSLEDEEMIDVGVYLPPGHDGGEDRYPALYFLHGMNGSARKWAERDSQLQLDQLIALGKVPPMIVICPDGRNSMYVNWLNGRSRWEDFIAEDLVEEIDARFRTRPEPKSRGLTGDSMGGYGVLLIGFTRPGVFGSLSAHSAALYSVDPEKLPAWIKQRGEHWKDIYGHPVDVEFWKSKNPLHLAATLDVVKLRQSALYFDVGKDDRFGYDATCLELDRILDEREVPHVFLQRAGDHGAEYFESYVQFSLLFHGLCFDGQDPEPGDYQTEIIKRDPSALLSKLGLEDLTVGAGAEAKKGSKVDIHYTGWLTDGTQFDSSRDRTEPFSFTIGQSRAIRGWHLGVEGMKEGGKRKLTIPPELAFGGRSQEKVPANSTVVFEIELLKVY